MDEQDDKRKQPGGRHSVPKTAAARERQLAKAVKNRKKIQNELAQVRAAERALEAAVKADRDRVRGELERAAGRMLLDIIAEKRRLAADGDERALKNAEYWMGLLDRAVRDPKARKLAGLEPEQQP